jgi:hypothetical protein
MKEIRLKFITPLGTFTTRPNRAEESDVDRVAERFAGTIRQVHYMRFTSENGEEVVIPEEVLKASVIVLCVKNEGLNGADHP